MGVGEIVIALTRRMQALKNDPDTKVRFRVGEDEEMHTLSGPEYEKLVDEGEQDLRPVSFYINGRWEDRI